MSLENVKALKQNALKCGLRSYRFRSIAWSVSFLSFFLFYDDIDDGDYE